MNANQLGVPVAAVRELLRRQFPRWADRPLTEGPFAGAGNALFRLGDDLVVRLPLQMEYFLGRGLYSGGFAGSVWTRTKMLILWMSRCALVGLWLHSGKSRSRVRRLRYARTLYGVTAARFAPISVRSVPQA